MANFPAAQDAHVPDPVVEYFPAVHVVDAVVHDADDDDPVEVDNFPVAQLVHIVAPADDW
jgi:hypothetical protein